MTEDEQILIEVLDVCAGFTDRHNLKVTQQQLVEMMCDVLRPFWPTYTISQIRVDEELGEVMATFTLRGTTP